MERWQVAQRIALGIVRRRKRLAVLVFALSASVLAPAAYYLSKEPPRFGTSATILLDSRPDRIPLFQEFSPFRPLPVQLALLKSRSLAEGVLESLPRASLQELIDTRYKVDYLEPLGNLYRRLRRVEPAVESPRRRALAELQEARVRFSAEGSDGIVSIRAEASKPEVAVDIVNTYIEVLLSRTRSFNVDDTRVTREFLERQVADVKRSLQSREEALRAFTVGHGGIKIPEQSQATVAHLSRTESTLAEVTAHRKVTEARLQGLWGKVENQKLTAVAPPSVQRLRDELSKLESTLIELRTRYTDEHPRVIVARDQIAEIRRELGSAVKGATTATPAPGAVPPAERVDFVEQVVALQTSLHGLTAQEDALRKQAAGLRDSLSGLSRYENEYSRLSRDVENNQKLYALLSDRLTAARIREQGEMKVVKVIDPPGPATPAANWKRMGFVGAALFIAAALGAGVPGLIEWRRRPVETEEDAESATGLPVLAVVPHLSGQRPLRLTARERNELEGARNIAENFLFNEAFLNLRVAIQLAGRADPLRTLMITSALPREGKSVVVANLALELGEAGRRVVLADADFVRPTLHRMLKVQQTGGLVEVLHEKRHVEETFVPVGDRVWVATQGPAVHRGTRGLLATDRLGHVLGEMSDKADFVLCDSSPVLLIPDNLFLAAAVDGVILVAKAGATGCQDLVRAKTLLTQVGAKIVGVVINDMPRSRLERRYRRYYKKGYYDGAPRSEAS